MRTLNNRYLRPNVTAKAVNNAVTIFDADAIFSANTGIDAFTFMDIKTIEEEAKKETPIIAKEHLNGLIAYLKRIASEAAKVVVKYNEETDRNSSKVLTKSGISQNCRLWGTNKTSIAAQDIDANKVVFGVCFSGKELVTDTMNNSGRVFNLPRLYANIENAI